MDKSNFKKMALMGMAGGLLLSQSPISAGTSTKGTNLAGGCGAGSCGGKYQPKREQHGCGGSYKSARNYTAEADQPQTYQYQSRRMMTENELMSQLNDEGKMTYRNMDAEGKALALQLASQDCRGRNDCKGLNSCDTSDHDCAGKGGCQGTGPGPFKDKNLAVKVAAQRMAEKRSGMNGGQGSWQSR